ncbi:MAG: hypothetical protein K6B67_05020 [Lachnospiraceae bacterium]|nr:hypothetical protein [Lachnospiraceae bacterium]
MKKVVIGIVAAIAVIGIIIGVVNVSKKGDESEKASKTENTATEKVDNNKAKPNFDGYIETFNLLKGKEVSLELSYDMEEGEMILKPDMGSGILAYKEINNGKNLLTIGYDTKTLEVVYTLYGFDELGGVVRLSEQREYNIFLLGEQNKANVYMAEDASGNMIVGIESWNQTSTLADGVYYRFTVVNVDVKQEQISETMDEVIAGSGDEDITVTIREKFNEVTGFNYTQDDFEDAFYYGNLISSNMDGFEVLASMEYESDTYQKYMAPSQEGYQELADKYMQLVDGTADTMKWGVVTIK